MAIIKISNRNAPIYLTPACTEMMTVLEPEIISMSLIEVDYTTYFFNSNMKATGTINDGDAWIKLVPFENTILPTYTNTAPIWDEIRKGYYESGTNNKYLLKFVKAGSEFQNKKLIYDRYGNIDIFVMNRKLKQAIDDIVLIDNRVTVLENSPVNNFTYFPTTLIKKKFRHAAYSISGLAFNGTNLISCGSGEIRIHDKISNTILSSFASPYSAPSGLVFDGTNLISCDKNSRQIYIHDGISQNILSNFTCPAGLQGNPSGLAFDGTNLISCDYGTNLIYIHSGKTATVSSSFSSPSDNPYSLVFDGKNLISCDYTTNLIYVHDKITDTILLSFASTGNAPNGLTSDGIDLISNSFTTDTVYKHYSQVYA